MGICLSSPSSEIHQVEEGLENVLYSKDDINSVNLGSIHSREGSKRLNQDAAFFHQGYGMKGGVLCGVFDGHGKNGHIVSKIVRNRLASLITAQKNALKDIKRRQEDNYGRACGDLVSPSIDFHEWKEACVSAFKVVDKEIKLQENLDCSCSGSTAVVVLRQDQDMIIANLGDSRAILGTIVDNDIAPVQLTVDLKPSVAREADRIRKCNGRIFALKAEPHIKRVWLPNEDSPGLAMSRSFGDFLLKNYGIIAVPDISYHRITPNDQFVVLATDGVWDVLTNDQVAMIVWAAGSEQAAAEAVVEAAVSTWKKKFPSSKIDDCTVVCLFLQKKQL